MTSCTLMLGSQLFRLDRRRSWKPDPDVEAYGCAYSLALVCPRCLSVWCTMAFEGDRECHPQGAYCERCAPSDPAFEPGVIPGSILPTYGSEFEPLLSVLPEALLKRELLLTLRQMEAL